MQMNVLGIAGSFGSLLVRPEPAKPVFAHLAAGRYNPPLGLNLVRNLHPGL